MAEDENGNVQVDLRIAVRPTRRGYTAYLNIAGERFQGSSTDRISAVYQLVYNLVTGGTSRDGEKFKDAIELLMDGTTLAEAVPPSTATEKASRRKDHDDKDHADKK